MSSVSRGFIALFCAWVMACAIDLRLGRSFNYLLPAGALPAALVAPTVIIPWGYYPGEFRDKELRDLGFTFWSKGPEPEVKGTEGYVWAVALALSFYLPFHLLPKRRRKESAATAADA